SRVPSYTMLVLPALIDRTNDTVFPSAKLIEGSIHPNWSGEFPMIVTKCFHPFGSSVALYVNDSEYPYENRLLSSTATTFNGSKGLPFRTIENLVFEYSAMV